MLIGLRLLFAVPLSIGGMFIVAPLLGITFGSIGMVLLKLAAINVLTLSIVLNVGFGGVPDFVGYAIAAPITWLLFKWMFQLEFTETWIAMTVIDLIQFLASLTITAVAFKASK